MEWVRNLDEKIVVSRNSLSLDVQGTHTPSLIHKLIKIYLCAKKVLFQMMQFLTDAEENTGFVTGIVLYRNLGPILSVQRCAIMSLTHTHTQCPCDTTFVL